MPEIKQENQAMTLQIVQKLLGYLNVDPSTSIAMARRLGKVTTSKPRSILLKMTSLAHRDAVLDAKKDRKMTANLFFENGSPNQNVYIDEQLTPRL